MLDALICNTDRHHENWGFLARFERQKHQAFTMHLSIAPSFDHASSLGRELLDEKRTRLLDQGRIGSYVLNGQGGVYLRSADPKGANPLHLACHGARLFPRYFQPALQRLAGVPIARIQECVDRVPGNRISEPSRAFAKELLSHTYGALVSSIT